MGTGTEIYVVAVILAVLAVQWLLTGRRRAAIRPLVRRIHAAILPRGDGSASFHGRAYIIDGDTLSVENTRIRMFGIDAPELSQYGGLKARSHLIRLAGGKEVRVQPIDVDCYGRTVARVWRGNVDLSDKMVRDGFARATSRWNSDYDSAESDARRQQRGLWCGNPATGIRDPAAYRRLKQGASPF